MLVHSFERIQFTLKKHNIYKHNNNNNNDIKNKDRNKKKPTQINVKA